MVIVKDMEYLDRTEAVDKDEYREAMAHVETIVRDALQYLEEYISIIKGERETDSRYFARKYGMSALPYFHRELGIAAKSSELVKV